METLGLFILVGSLTLSIPFWIIALSVVFYIDKATRQN